MPSGLRPKSANDATNPERGRRNASDRTGRYISRFSMAPTPEPLPKSTRVSKTLSRGFPCRFDRRMFAGGSGSFPSAKGRDEGWHWTLLPGPCSASPRLAAIPSSCRHQIGNRSLVPCRFSSQQRAGIPRACIPGTCRQFVAGLGSFGGKDRTSDSARYPPP